MITNDQIAQYAYNAGFRGDALTNAVAVALAESGGNEYATNYNTNGTTDYGLWQINSVHGYNSADMFDPQKNANAAYQVWKNANSSFSPWVAFTNGRYKNFLGVAQVAAQTIGNVVSGITDAILSVLKIFYNAVVTQPFGPTSLSLEPAYQGYPHFHEGVDLSVPSGTALPSLVNGTVSKIVSGCKPGDPSCGNGYGNQVWIQLANGSQLLYGHLQNVNVSNGQSVSVGQTLGLTNNTGASTGPHVHVGLQDLSGNWIDPQPYIDAAKSGNVNELAGIAGSASVGDIPVIGGVVSGAQDMYDAAKKTLETLLNGFSYLTDPKKRPILLFLILGTAITLYSLRGMIMGTEVGQQAVSTAKKAAKVAAVA